MEAARYIISAFLVMAAFYLQAFSQVEFRDITDESGIGERHEYGWGTAMLDYNYDGRIDILIAGQNGTCRLFRNESDLRFADVTEVLGIHGIGAIWGVCYGDFDSDYDEDIYFSARDGGRNSLYVFDNGVYTERAVEYEVDDYGGYGYSACFAPLTKNMMLDLIVTNQHWPVRHQSNRVFAAHLDGPFTDVTEMMGLADSTKYWDGVGCTDYDNDAEIDIFIAADAPNKLYRNMGNGRFVDVTDSVGFHNPSNPDTTGQAVTWGDYDNDGWMDLYVSYWHDQHGELWHNNGDGTFTEASHEAGIGAEVWAMNASWGDFDNDGWSDLFVATASYGNHLYYNNHDGTFTDIVDEAGVDDSSWCHGVSLGDIDRDGRLDLLFSHNAGPILDKGRLFRNITNNSNNWVEIRINGIPPNPDAIGARATLYAGGIMQLREVTGGNGFGSQNMLPLHFGLGGASVIDTLIITFPNINLPPIYYHGLGGNGYYELPDVTVDAAALKVIRPDTVVDCEEPQEIEIVVANTGNVDVAGVKVICQITGERDTVVTDTFIVSYMLMAETLSVPFGAYQLPRCHENYTVRGMTKLLGDRRYANDTTTLNLFAAYSHDLSCGPVLSPGPDSTHFPITPSVVISNEGINDENNFGVGCIISYADSEVYREGIVYHDTLVSGGNADVIFPAFVPQASGLYTFMFYHTLQSDRYAANNYASISVELEVTDIGTNETLPTDFSLYQNFPNPFNSVTEISFDTPKLCDVRLDVYNITGQMVGTLIDGPVDAGRHNILFDTKGLSSGIYIYRLEADSRSYVKRMVLLK